MIQMFISLNDPFEDSKKPFGDAWNVFWMPFGVGKGPRTTQNEYQKVRKFGPMRKI